MEDKKTAQSNQAHDFRDAYQKHALNAKVAREPGITDYIINNQL